MSRIAGAAFKGLAELAGPIKAFATPSPGIRSGLGKLGRGAEIAGFDFSSPTNALAFGVPTAMFAGSMLSGLGSGVKEEFTGVRNDLQEELRRQRFQAAQVMKAQRLQRAMADNMMRLAKANPQLYNQLMVGRTLPQGAVVIGGGQRSDFLESVAYQMATGGFGNGVGTPDSPDIMQSLVDSY